MSSPVLLVLGAGPNVGLAVARKFRKQGYKVAAAARHPTADVAKAADLVITADFSDPTAVAAAFHRVKEELGVPSVVVYNGASRAHHTSMHSSSEVRNLVTRIIAAYAFHPAPGDPFSLSTADFQSDLVVNTTSAFAAAQEATRGFATLPANTSRTFIYTGNILNIPGRRIPGAASLGAGKSATAHLVANAAAAHAGKGYKYYYADERTPEGESVMHDISGDAHGEFYYELASGREQGPWLATFVKGKGYVDFSAKDRG
ncbi:putative short-chain dehydrogenase [Neolentinus lepideus HHB14362 ss-1]|uniref:Putative short-chain dehydrogenase n=1 Tax=Neolentinus lepideus HHB14362 ss-1 TaxID=1314782 RepID=A0A165VTW7_9AGAM|nr:putative short-chain dehydrogenase [Neolentinus lepideus HHB14362 ss-1]